MNARDWSKRCTDLKLEIHKDILHLIYIRETTYCLKVNFLYLPALKKSIRMQASLHKKHYDISQENASNALQ